MISLTPKNYHSREANNAFADGYMSVSQYKAWRECPAAWAARYVSGEFEPEPSAAMAAGTLGHAYLLGSPAAADTYLKETPALTKAKGAPTAEAEAVLVACRHVAANPDLAVFLEGGHEVILSDQVGPFPFKVQIDVLGERLITDLKFVANASGDVWANEWSRKVHWAYADHYDLQVATYLSVARGQVGGERVGCLLAIGKPTAAMPVPDCLVWRFTDTTSLAFALESMMRDLETVKVDGNLWLSGDRDRLPRCEQCLWCRQSRTRFVVDMPPRPAPRE